MIFILRHALNHVFFVHISTGGVLFMYVSGTYVGTCYTFLVAIEQISRLNDGGLIRDGMISLLVSALVLIPVIIENINISDLI